RGWTKSKLSLTTGISRTTLDNLEGSRRAPMTNTVHTLADHLGIPRDEAEVLAGLRPESAATDPGVVAAIEASSVYNEEQKRMLLDMVRTIDRANDRTSGAPADQNGAGQHYSSDRRDAG